MRGSLVRNTLLVTVVASLSLAMGDVAESRRPPCGAARFVEFGGVPLLGPDFPGTAVIDLQGKQVTLGECGSATARVRRTGPNFSHLKAKWAPCGTVSRVTINASIYEPCQFLVGIVAPRGLHRWKFRAENPDRLH